MGITLRHKSRKGEETTDRMKLKNYKVLVVDDETGVRDLVVSILSNRGHRCRGAANAEEALHVLGQNGFDAVISDIVMPGMDGIALTKELLRRHPGLPIMLITGYAEIFSAEAALSAGAQEIIRKPFSIDEFYLRFLKMMSDHERLRRLEAKRSEMAFKIKSRALKIMEELENEIEELTSKLSTLYRTSIRTFLMIIGKVDSWVLKRIRSFLNKLPRQEHVRRAPGERKRVILSKRE